MKSRVLRVAACLTAALAVLVMAVLLLFPDQLASWLGQDEAVPVTRTETKNSGSGLAVLEVSEEKREYDGNGIFDPLQGVTALDNDGTDLKNKVAVAYVSGSTIRQKTIRYSLYDSNGEKLEASCQLTLNQYEGPDITCEPLQSADFETMDDLAEVWVQEGVLHGDDGFGNDASGSITSYYELDVETGLAEVTFSISNQFGDVKVLRISLTVENIPADLVPAD